MMQNKQLQVKPPESYVYIIGLLLLLDVGLNSSLDYDLYLNNLSPILVLLCGLIQIGLQCITFLVFYIFITNTITFQFGFYSKLYQKFWLTCSIFLLYVMFTSITLALRYQFSIFIDVLYSLWTDDSFPILSIVQKIIAIPYYLVMIRSSIHLLDEEFYDRKKLLNESLVVHKTKDEK